MASLRQLDYGQFLLVSAICLVLWVLYTIVYNLFLSPLAKFPGSKLAALSSWYEFYWDGIHKGQYYFRIEEMHKKYGPIIRIGPDQLHVSDPDFITTVFAPSGKRRSKYEVGTRVFGSSEAGIATLDHETHRMRRGAVGKYFSKEGIRRAEPIIHGALERFFKRLDEFRRSGQPLTISLVYMAFSSDIITEYCFAAPYNYLDHPDFNAQFFEMSVSVLGIGPLARRLPWLMPLMDMIPPSIVTKMDPGMGLFVQFREDMRGRIRNIQSNKEHYDNSSHPTVFRDILDSNLPQREKTVERLWQEAQVFIFAGTETAAWMLSVTTFYILSTPHILQKLKVELRAAIPDAHKIPSWKELEQLPYLSAVIQEGLRLSIGVSTRQHRICPDETLVFDDGGKKWVIPLGTAIAMSNPIIHFNPELFPEPNKFDPERWIKSPGLEKYLWSFSKGPRQCLGINLAYAEIFLCIAMLFRRFDGPSSSGKETGDGFGTIELFKTTLDDVTFHYDMFGPFPKEGSEGVRVLLK